MARRPQGTQYQKIEASTLIRTGIGVLYSVHVSWTGGNAGDRVVIYDNTSASGTAMEEIFLGATAGNISLSLPTVGKQFLTGLYVLIVSGGQVTVSIGWD